MPPGFGYSITPTAGPSWYGGNAAPNVSQARTPTTPNLPVNAIPTPSSIGALAGLTTNINNMLLAGTKAAQGARIPGGPALEQKSSDVIGQELGGGVPDDVIKLLQQQSAEGAPGTGVNPQAAYLRALGLTSIEQQQRGEQNLSAATARNPAAPIFDPATQLLTPGQAGNLALGQQQQNLAAQSEADRVALENARLALESSRLTGGGGGGGGYGGQVTTPGAGIPNYGDIVSGQAYGAATPGYGFTFPDEGTPEGFDAPANYDELFGSYA